jgi:AraC family transcriptional activator of pobA
MMKHFKSLADMHRLNGIPAPEHPLFSVVRCNVACSLGDREFTTDFYMIGLKKLKAGTILYGRTKYDHETGSMIFIKPRQVIEFKDLEFEQDAFMIFIHEDYFNGHHLLNEVNTYAFFDYESNEALHLSPREEQVMWELYFKILAEYQSNVDEYSKDIILTHLDSMLKYSQRFYRRQFINRKELSGKTVSKFNKALSSFFEVGRFKTHGLPNVALLAAQLNLSPRYLSDLLKQETGKTAIELIHIHLIGQAKNRLAGPEERISEIAYTLGFESPAYFSKLFKKATGVSPNQFRKFSQIESSKLVR